MSTKRSSSDFLADLQRPLRDALRGMATLADSTEDMLEPAARLLPEPLRSRVTDALASLEQAGKRLLHAPLDTDRIAAAARFLTGDETGAEAAGRCASVMVYAWEHLDEAGFAHRHLISETIVAERLACTAAAARGAGAEVAAALLADLRISSAIGRMPGLARGITATEEAEVDLALLAIAVWLLSARAETLAQEEKLLHLAMGLVRALQGEAREAFADQRRLAAFLAATSAHL